MATAVQEAVHHARLPLLLSEDQVDMREAVRSFLANVLPAPSADAASWEQVDASGSLWRRMATELGLQGLTLPDEVGGQGFGMAEAAILFEELGRALCSAPLFGTTILAGRTLHRAGADDLLAGIAAGDVRATGALDSAATVQATGQGSEHLLTGRVLPLIDGDVADAIVLAAAHPEGTAVYLLDPTARGVERTALTAVDLTRGFARLTLEDAPARLVVAPGEADEILARVRDEAVILLAAESVGAARKALASSVEYSSTRKQFGQPIGSFQALKHRMADILVSIEGAWSTVRYASVLADLVDARDDLAPHDLAMAASVARVASERALSFAAAECIQIHGGIGFTWEYSAHLAYRRAVSNAQLLGSPAEHRAAIVALQRRQG